MDRQKFPYPPTDRWGMFFWQIDQLLLFTPGLDSVWEYEERERFIREVKEPCHTEIYEMGLTPYLPVSHICADDLAH